MAAPVERSLTTRLARYSLRARVGMFFALLGVAGPVAVGFILAGVAAALPGELELEARQAFGSYAILGGLVLGGLVAGVAILFDRNVALPIQGLIRDIQTVLHANADHVIEVKSGRHLGLLPETVRDMARVLADARHETARQIADATAATAQVKGRLEALLRDLHEGVILCTLNHQILLYNQEAVRLLHLAGEIGLGRPLFSVMNRHPFIHALERLTNRFNEGRHKVHPQGLTAPFLCSTVDGRHALEGQMSLVLEGSGERITGYVITFQDVTQELTVLGQRDALLRQATEGMRGPVANLRAAVETMTSFPDIEPASRKAFEDIALAESRKISERVENLAREYRSAVVGHWPTTDVYSANLISLLVRRMTESGVAIMMTGIPQWLHADSYSLVEAVEHLIAHIRQQTGITNFDLEASNDGKRINLDIIWRGTPMPSAVLNAWTDEPLKDALGGLTLREVLEHHGSELWSETHRDGHARLRLPLPPARQPAAVSDAHVLPARPEFYDFSLLEQRPQAASVLDSPLKALTYVVFDTETTGLLPDEGDEMISIAGVRVVNGRILTGESFSRLVNPGREIPKASIRFHGITDDMVRDKPPAKVVLPQFRDFCGDAVLVAHNAAFDMKFLRLKERESGVRFDNPVLCSLLLGQAIFEHGAKHTLDALAERFGITIEGRHTALGDALTTAAVFLRLIDLCEGLGIRSLRDALNAAERIVDLRAQQAKF